MQKLEIVVVAKDWNEVITIMAAVGINDKNNTGYRDIDGLYIVSVENHEELSDEDYEKIKADPRVAIISDSSSRKRTAEVLDKVYEVETQLRKLLLHAYDLTEVFFDVFSKNSSYTKDYTKERSITRAQSLDPITSRLMLGEMIAILGQDVSWDGKSINTKELNDLLSSSHDFEDFKQNFNKKVQPLTVWDIIAANVLHSKKVWHDVSGDLSKLKDFRNQSAHFQVVTEKKKDELIEKVNTLLPKITPSRKPSKAEQQNITYFANTLSKVFSKQFKDQTEYNKKLLALLQPDISSSLKIVNASSEELAKSIKNLSPAYMEYLKDMQNITYSNPFVIQDEDEEDEVNDTDEPNKK